VPRELVGPPIELRVGQALVPAGHSFEMSIEEQAATLMTDGLSYVTDRPQLNVFATFAAFMEGIAREGFEFWRYQRNLDGANEGLNVLLHLAHVGANTGRDHFSGWSLDWINLALGYMPFLHRFYAPADARAAFIAVRDAAAHYGGHIVAVPRDTLPVLSRQGSKDPLFQIDDAWTPATVLREVRDAKTVILTIGAPSYMAASAADSAAAQGVPVDGYYDVEVKAEAVNRKNPYDPKLFAMDPDAPFRLGIVPGNAKVGALHHTQPIEPRLGEVTVRDNAP
jgi:transketolase C-terminal domain/subunit